MATALDVAKYLGQGDSAPTVALAGERLPIVASFVRSYVRGNGFDFDGLEPNDALDNVIVSVTARMIANPAGVASQASGPFSVSYAPTLQGFTLLELSTLNLYRKRAA